jgi:hypothetical protein
VLYDVGAIFLKGIIGMGRVYQMLEGLSRGYSDNSLELLNKLIEHPNGVQLLELFKDICEQTQQHQQATVEIVKGRSASRVMLLNALELAREQLIIVSPWLSKRSIDQDVLLRMNALLDRGCRLAIGWGYSYDIRGIHPDGRLIQISKDGQCVVQVDSTRSYDAYPDLVKLRNQYPEQFELKLLGTHEKYLVCDRQFALMSSHNVLSSRETLYAPREMGWKTSDPDLLDEQIQIYREAPDLRLNFRLAKEFSHC